MNKFIEVGVPQLKQCHCECVKELEIQAKFQNAVNEVTEIKKKVSLVAEYIADKEILGYPKQIEELEGKLDFIMENVEFGNEITVRPLKEIYNEKKDCS